MSSTHHDNGHPHENRSTRRERERREAAIEYLNSPPSLYENLNLRGRNARLAKHVTHLEIEVPRAPRRDCAALAERVAAKEVTRPQAVAMLRERWEGGNVTTSKGGA